MSTSEKKRRVRVLMISEPGRAGVKRHVVDLLMHLDLEQFEVLYVYSLVRSDACYREEIQAITNRGIRCVEVPLDCQPQPWRDGKALLKLVGLVRSFRPDIIHGHSAKAGLLARVVSLVGTPRPRVIYTPNCLPCDRSAFYHRLEQAAGWLTDTMVAVSPSEREDFLRWRVVGLEKIACIPLAIEAEKIAEQRAPSPEGEWVVSACGRIAPGKNALFFFQCGQLLLERDHRVKVKWVGDFDSGPDRTGVRDFLEKMRHRDRVEITGWTDEPIPQLAASSVFCMFSQSESFGYVTADAMALGIPVVALDCTGTRDLVLPGRTGYLVEPDPEAAADAIWQLLQAPEQAKEVREQAYAYIREKFCLSKMLHPTELLYKGDCSGLLDFR